VRRGEERSDRRDPRTRERAGEEQGTGGRADGPGERPMGRARVGEKKKRGKEKRPRAGGARLDRGVGCARREREEERWPRAGLQGGGRKE
jgi:hypothetical protein